MEREIRDTLDRIETREDVRVLYAVESGSRAWGFASTDSDWDVRFLYLRRPEWYLSIQRRRDVLEYPLADGLDVSGWDLKQALGLFAKSNPPLLEWLRSPIVYREAFSAPARLRVLSARWWRTSCPHGCVRSSRRCSHASAPATSWPRVPGLPRSTSFWIERLHP